MTKQTEALKLALEALDNLMYWDNGKPEYDEARQAITALREALTSVPDWASEAIEQPAQPQQEPLTDSQIMASIGRHWGGEKTSISQSRPVGQQWDQICELVRCVIRERYTSPPAQRKPLTDEQIDLFINGRGDEGDDDYVEPTGDGFGLTDADLVRLVRRVEAAHGIKE